MELLKLAPQTAELERRLQKAEYQKQQAELEKEIAIKEMEAQKKLQMELLSQFGTRKLRTKMVCSTIYTIVIVYIMTTRFIKST